MAAGCFASRLQLAVEWRRTSQWREAEPPPKQRNTLARIQKIPTSWRKSSKRRRGQGRGSGAGADQRCADEAHFSARTSESAAYCTVFLPRDSRIKSEMVLSGKTYKEKATTPNRPPEQGLGSPHVWLFSHANGNRQGVKRSKTQTERLRQ